MNANERELKGKLVLVRGVIPKGLSDRSQPRKRSDPYPGLNNRPNRGTPIGPNHTVPYGTGLSLYMFQAVNCLATIIQSLRDDISCRK
jgi:hypothetical protein